jgi:16S rRNA processing protein RimM
VEPKSLVEIGVIVRPHGVHGEVLIRPHNPDTQVIAEGVTVFLCAQSQQDQYMVITRAKKVQKGIIVRFEGVKDRGQATMLRGSRVFVRREDLKPLEEGEFYLCDIVGACVKSPSGKRIGTVKGFLKGATEIMIVEEDGEEVLVPLVEGFVLQVSKESVLVDESRLEMV